MLAFQMWSRKYVAYSIGATALCCAYASAQVHMANNTSPVMAFLISAVLFILVLIIGYMALRLYKRRRRLSGLTQEGFSAWSLYSPSCGGYGVGNRGACRGLTSGSMPSIDASLIPVSWEPSCGNLGVPPPVYTNPFGAREN